MFFEKVSLVTGGFDPIHSGHISYFKRAKDLSNYLVVGLNTEESGCYVHENMDNCCRCQSYGMIN